MVEPLGATSGETSQADAGCGTGHHDGQPGKACYLLGRTIIAARLQVNRM